MLDPAVLKDGATYKIWYAGHDGANMRIYYATSSNGLEWTKYDNTIPTPSDGSSTNGKIPLGTAGKGDVTHVAMATVLKDNSPPIYKMWYFGNDAGAKWRIYYATSSNGLEWTKLDNTIPADSDTTNSNSRVGLGTAGKGDVFHLFSSTVLKDDSASTYKMWYVGASDATYYRIYYATFRIPPSAGTIFTFK